MRKVLFILLIMSSIMGARDTYAQDPYYAVINKAVGLPSNSVYDLYQDTKGFIWIANNEGLTRYDGFEYKTYSSDRQTSRSGNEIIEDKYGRIWYKNFDGYLYYVEHDTMKALKQNTAIGNSGYGIINDRLLVFQANGIDIFDLATLQIVKSLSFQSIGVDVKLNISTVCMGDYFYLLNSQFLLSISGKGDVRKFPVSELGMMSVGGKGIVMVDKTKRWRGMMEFADGRWTQKMMTADISYIHGLQYCDGKYWLFTPGGVWAYTEEGKDVNNGKPFFSSKSISCVLKDREGNYWFGTLDDGIVFVPDLKTKLITPPGFIPNTLLAVGDRMYIGTKDNSIYSFDIATGAFAEKYHGAVRHEVLHMLADTVNKRFFFSCVQFYVSDLSFNTKVVYPGAVKDVALIDHKYAAYAATGVTGLVRVADEGESPWDSVFKAGSVPQFPELSELLVTGRGRTIAYDREAGALYTGSNIGLYRITPRGSQELRYEGNSVYTRRIVYHNGIVYILTPQDHIFIIGKEGKLTLFYAGEGGEKLLNLRKAGTEVYLITNTGIRLLDEKAHSFRPLILHPGIRSGDINDIDAIGNKLVIASDRGLILVDRSEAGKSVIKPAFTINSILVNGIKVVADKMQDLSHKENDIDISYSILSFSTDVRYGLYYKVNDGKWQTASPGSRELKLASLAPGNYEISFELRSENGNSFVQPSIKFTIKKPFWTEWWFGLICLGVVSAGSYSYYRWQTQLLKKQNALVLEKVELEKNLRNSMLTSIRAQMNPHFFYNALNAIQSFIFSDDKRNASTYLVKLSRLTRMILEMSEKESVSLYEETEALTLYLELEKMRFDSDFHFELVLGSNFDGELVKIPPMIVQPYVENAIKHGLLHKKGNKYLSISFTKDNGTLCVTIDDNGIGREKAGEIKQIKKEKHHPFSTYANSRRIELLNKERNKDIGVVYTDKKDEYGNPVGTTVVISIPLY